MKPDQYHPTPSEADELPASEESGRESEGGAFHSEPSKGGRVTISPPANVRDAPDSFRILASGIDSLVLSFDVHWQNDSLFTYLAKLKAKAQENGEEAAGEMKAEKGLGEWRFAVKAHGADGYEWLLVGKEFALKIGSWLEPKSRPSVMAEIRSEALWRIGVRECVAGLSSLLRGSGASRLFLKPSRVDLCMDVLFPEGEWKPDLLRYRVTRAQKSQAYFRNDRLTGFMIGEGKLAARLYDKAFEIERQSKKVWMYRIWGIPSVPEGKKIIRIEFQARREALTELGIIEFTHLIQYQGNLWRYCSDKWLKFMDSPGKHHVTQRAILPWWETVQTGFKGAQEACPLIRGAAFRKDRERLFQQTQGLLSSMVALHFEDVGHLEGQPIDFNALLMANFESAYKEGARETFREKVLRKIYKYHRLALKSEEIKKQRTESGFPT